MAEIREYKKETESGSDKAPKAKKIAKKAPKAEPVNNGSFAVIETGGKQYRVSVGDTVKVEKILTKTENGTSDTVIKEGDEIIFDKVLLIDNGTDATDIGTPYIAGAKVSGTLIEIGRNAKVIVIKYKQKSRYFKKNGHRQPFFKVKIEKIG
jgi:large subunit ribosomal protein L21